MLIGKDFKHVGIWTRSSNNFIISIDTLKLVRIFPERFLIYFEGINKETDQKHLFSLNLTSKNIDLELIWAVLNKDVKEIKWIQ